MELHSQGKTMGEIAECLKRAPLHPRIISAIKSAHASGYFFFFPNHFSQCFIYLVGF